MPLKPKATSIGLSRLSYLEFFQMVQQTVRDLDKSQKDLGDDTDYPHLIVEMRQRLAAYEKGLDSEKSRKLSQELIKADALRDGDLKTLRKQIKAFSDSHRGTDADDYHVLDQILTEYKDIERSHMGKESSQVNQLLKKLATDTPAQAINNLGLKRFVTNLKESQAAFEELFDDTAQAKLDATVYDMKALREALQDTYTTFVDYTEVMCRVRKDQLFPEMLKLINHNRDTYANSLKHKGKRKEVVA